jgi:hypothetical protein
VSSALFQFLSRRIEMLGLIFSRDRAMQLDGMLRSFFRHCQDDDQLQLVVLYKTSDQGQAEQYQQLAGYYFKLAGVKFLPQKDFRKDVFQILLHEAYGNAIPWQFRVGLRLGPKFGFLADLAPSHKAPKSLLFLVDDNLFVRDFSLGQVEKTLFENRACLGFSLRLGTNTTYCYPHDKAQSLPPFENLPGGILKYSWASAEEDFGYPLEVSSSVYRLSQILKLLMKIPFSNPNYLEGRMASRARAYASIAPYLLCFEHSVTFCNPVNVVQTVLENRRAAAVEYSSRRLSELFDRGYRIKVDAFDGFTPNACHQEAALTFESLKDSGDGKTQPD